MSYRPVSFKPSAYNHNNDRHRQPLPRFCRTFEHPNKENLYAIPRRQQQSRAGLFRGDSASELPTTSTQVGEMEPVCFEKHMKERELFSTSSSLSDDELELSRKKKRERFSTHYSTSDLTTSDSSIGPSWINGRFIPIPSLCRNTVNSTTSLECSDNLQHEFELDNEDNDDLDSVEGIENSEEDSEDLGNQHKNIVGSFLKDLRRLDSIEESPVLPSPSNIQDVEDLPPQITPLRFATSATVRFPHTNPYHHQQKTPRRMAFEQPRSLFELKPARSEEFGLPSQMAKHYDIKGVLFMTITMAGLRSSKTHLNVFVQHGTYFLQRYPELSTYITVEIKYNKRFKKRNKAIAPNLQIYKSSLVRRSHQPDFNHNASFLLNKENFCSHDKLGISVYATNPDDITGSSSSGHELIGCMTFSLRRLREKAKEKLESHFRSEDSRVKVGDGGYFILGDKLGRATNMPQDKIFHRKYYDEIGSTTFSTNPRFDSSGMIGESEWRATLQNKDPKLMDLRRHSVQVGSNQRIPLNGRPASSNQHLCPNAQHYTGTNVQNIETGIVSTTRNENRYGPFSALINGSPRKKVNFPLHTISADPNHHQHHQHRKEQQQISSGSSLMSKGASSSNSSSSSAGYKSHYRFTLPSIVTTTTEGSDSANGSTALHPDSVKVNQHMLHADASSAQSQQAQQQMASVKSKKSKTHKELQSTNSHRFLTNQPSVSNDDDVPIVHHGVVRRVASFTYSTDEKHGKQAGKKFNFASINKIGSLIRGKADVSSTSTLYPTREEVLSWQHSFDNLLRDKYGRHLFRQFVTAEVSSENLDFYENVEEFKKLKPGKKATIQKANEIYNTYLKEGAKRELNLDAETRTATGAAFKAGCLPDTFNLSQCRIEQLMATDSYRRFINSELYLDLLSSVTNFNAPNVIPSSISAETAASTPEEPQVVDTKPKSESPVNDRQVQFEC